MALIRSRKTLDEILDQYVNGDKGDMKLRSFHLYPYQDAIINKVCESTGKSKAQVIRDLIDEWCEKLLVDNSESGIVQ